MHIDNEVIDAIRIGHLRPAGAVQHLNTELVVILYGLYDKIATHIVALVGLVEEFHAIIIAFDGRGLVRPELGKVLQDKRRVSYSLQGAPVATVYSQCRPARRATQWSVHCDPRPFARNPLSCASWDVG